MDRMRPSKLGDVRHPAGSPGSSDFRRQSARRSRRRLHCRAVDHSPREKRRLAIERAGSAPPHQLLEQRSRQCSLARPPKGCAQALRNRPVRKPGRLAKAGKSLVQGRRDGSCDASPHFAGPGTSAEAPHPAAGPRMPLEDRAPVIRTSEEPRVGNGQTRTAGDRGSDQ